MRKRIWLVPSLLVLALLGVGGAFAAAALTTGTVSACATTPDQTIADNGSPIATVPGESSCTTVTYTVPTETVTTTVAGTTTAPTAPTATTAPSTTTTAASADPTFASETAYTQNPPALTPSRTVNVSSASELKAALSNLQAGDLVQATAPFTVTGETVISNRLSAPAELDLGSYVHFVYSAGSELPAVWIKNAQNLRIYGGDLSTADTGGSCIVWYGSQHVLWWGFTAHDCGGTGIGVTTAKPTSDGSWPQPVEYNDIEGEIWKMGQHPAWDNHQEKCTGLHGANLADSNYAPFDHNRFAFYVHDSACEGGGIEFGASQSTNIPDSNTVILQCLNLTFVSLIQTGGNCYQTWGYGNTNTDIKYLVASNIEGHAYWPGGMYQKPSKLLATDTVEYGRASNTDLNSRYAKDCTFNAESGTVFQDVSPVPCLAPYTS